MSLEINRSVGQVSDKLFDLQVLLIFSLVSTHSVFVLSTPRRESKDMLPRDDKGVARSPNTETLFGLASDSTKEELERGDKSLLNTFPFNLEHQEHHHEGGDHHEHHEHHEHDKHHEEHDKVVARNPYRKQN